LARGCIWYSAVSHPLPLPIIHAGTVSSMEAVQRTTVRPACRGRSPRRSGEVGDEFDRAVVNEGSAVGAVHGGGIARAARGRIENEWTWLRLVRIRDAREVVLRPSSFIRRSTGWRGSSSRLAH
jgi:hypothetical protein